MLSHKPPYRNIPRPVKGLFFVGLMAALLLLLGWVVMQLWNAILPAVTSARPLNYWQAVGLLLLSRILFGGIRWHRPGGYPSKRHQLREKWISMSEEEKAQFRQKWKERCGHK